MASKQPQFAIATVVLLLLLVAVPSTVISRKLCVTKTVKPQPTHHFQDGEVVKVEGRIGIEVADYPSTGANNNHDPKSPGTPL